MQLKTILNRVEPCKSFVYGIARWVDDASRPTIEVELRPRKNDRLPERRFEFVPLWGIAIHFLYAPRRVECPTCGVKAERVPWADGKSPMTTSYRW